MIIAGDIGGTKTVIALYERTTGGLHQAAERVFASARYDALEAILSEFLRDHGAVKLESACFGIAGAIIEGRVHTTNLTWERFRSRPGNGAEMPRQAAQRFAGDRLRRALPQRRTNCRFSTPALPSSTKGMSR